MKCSRIERGSKKRNDVDVTRFGLVGYNLGGVMRSLREAEMNPGCELLRWNRSMITDTDGEIGVDKQEWGGGFPFMVSRPQIALNG